MIPSRLVPAAALIALVPAVIVAVVLILVGLPVWLALVIGLLAGAALVGWLTTTATSSAMSGLDARPVDEASEPRVFNLLDGLVFAHGLEHPDVAVIETAEPNAAVIGTAKTPNIVMTRGLLSALDRMQLEGVLAQLLTTARDNDLPARTVAASFARVLPNAGLRSWLLGSVTEPDSDVQADFSAVDLTRYPPALASAYGHLIGRSTTVSGVTDLQAHLWLAAPVSGQEIASRWSIPDRQSALQEL